ncbi:MAG: ComEC/Rec2 family competence protein [Candidatus Omnitrophota bacterium]
MKQPLSCLAVIFCLGIIFANLLKIPFTLIYFLAVLSLILSFLSLRKETKFDLLLLCLSFYLGALSLMNSQTLPKHHIYNYISYKDSQLKTISGYIDSALVFRNHKTSFVFRAQELIREESKVKCSGKVLVYINGRKDLRYGEVLILKGNLNMGRGNFGRYLNRKGIYAILNVKEQVGVVKLNKNRGYFLKKYSLEIRKAMQDVIFENLEELPAEMLNAMILGERSNIPKPIRNSMVKSGTVHILVVSGFHVGVVAFIIIMFLKVLRLPRNPRFCAAITCLLIYCLITGASTSVVRATIMAVFFIVGSLIKREPDIYNSCALAMISILAVNPRQLFDLGFQLSFVSVISIVYLYPKMKSFLQIGNLKIRVLRYLISASLVSLSCLDRHNGVCSLLFQDIFSYNRISQYPHCTFSGFDYFVRL